MPVALALYNRFLAVIATLQPLMLLLIRLWMAHVFWVSGILKIQDFDTTLLLFTDEHPVPFLPPYVAAVCGTFFELVCPVLLTLGLATRLATLPLLAMTAVIQFTYQDNIEHIYWAIVLGVILFVGPGKCAVDHYIARKYKGGAYAAA